MVTLIFSAGRSHPREGSFTTLDIIKLKKRKPFKMMWTFICRHRCRHRRVLDFVKAHIAIPCEAIIVPSSPNPCRVNSLQKELSTSRNPQSVLCALAVSGPSPCPAVLCALHHRRVGPTQGYFTGILGSQQPWQRVDNPWQEITGRGEW